MLSYPMAPQDSVSNSMCSCICVCVGEEVLAVLGQRSVMVLGCLGRLAHVALSLWPWAEEGTEGPEELWAFC